MARWFYTVFYYLITPLILLRLCYRAFRAPAYRHRVAERFGIFAAPDWDGCIWLHSVSVGETIAAAPIIKQLQQQRPDLPIVVTTMTPTGSERVHAMFGDSVFHVYAPYDMPGAIGRFLQKVKPRLLIIMETELWPNTLFYCRQQSIPTVLANARLSARSAAGYDRLSKLTRPMLKNLTRVVAQNQDDGQRFLELGLSQEQLEVSGSIKFDITISADLKARAAGLKAQWSNSGQRVIFIAASTHEGEDAIILQAFKRVLAELPELLLVLVPRHPERFDRVAAQAGQSGLNIERRSSGAPVGADTQVVIGDTMGELLLLFGCADIAFVGGSLVPTGGHNMLEPAAWGLPIITGESDFNFLEISRLLQEKSALFKVADDQSLAERVLALGRSESQRLKAGANALAVVDANRGALDRLMREIVSYL